LGGRRVRRAGRDGRKHRLRRAAPGGRGDRLGRVGLGGRGHGRAPWTSFSTYFAITSTSRLTGSPTVLRPSVVSSRVAGIRLTVNAESVTDTTVREMPSTVMEPFSTT